MDNDKNFFQKVSERMDRSASFRPPPHFKGARHRVTTRQRDSVRAAPLYESLPLPLLVEPAVPDLDVAAWVSGERALVSAWLLEYRAVLFRGFQVDSIGRLEGFASATSDGALMDCPDESTPRAALANRVYESTVYPSHQSIHLHNEASYCSSWPLKIYFCCLQPAREGGATPLADVRRVAAHIDAGVLDRFARLGVAYTRNFNTDGIGLSWQQAFWTGDPHEVEAYCRLHDIQFEWQQSGGLRTTTKRPAFRRHPATGEMLWFNHAVFFHLASYSQEMREALIGAIGRDRLPFETCYGDGSPIEHETVQSFLSAFEREKVTFPWQRGDVLLLDNMTIAHGRQPYEGERSIIVAMTEAQNG